MAYLKCILVALMLATVAALECDPAPGGTTRIGDKCVSPGRDGSGNAGFYVILTKAGVTNVPGSAVTGNIGVSPIALTAVTGFALTASTVGELAGKFSESTAVTGSVYAADFGGKVAANLTTAVGTMELAYTDAASRSTTTATNVSVGGGKVGVAGFLTNASALGAYKGLAGGASLDGFTLTPGVYTWISAITLGAGGHLNLRGNDTDIFILQTTGGVTMGANAMVNLLCEDGNTVGTNCTAVKPENVFWQVAGAVTLGASAHLEGIILTKTATTLGTSASIRGRVLAQTACTMIMNEITEP